MGLISEPPHTRLPKLGGGAKSCHLQDVEGRVGLRVGRQGCYVRIRGAWWPCSGAGEGWEAKLLAQAVHGSGHRGSDPYMGGHSEHLTDSMTQP